MGLKLAAAAATLFTIAAITPATAQMSQGEYWDHNGSYMSIIRDGNSLTIRYVDPKSSMRRHGVRPGTVLFRGRITGSRIRGTAYTFRRGCQPASYNVSGRFERNDTYSAHRVYLNGASPVREGCEVVGYTRNSGNAHLEFRYGGTGD